MYSPSEKGNNALLHIANLHNNISDKTSCQEKLKG